MDLTTITPAAHALKALAHPVRLRILGILRADGPATATTLAVRLGLNSGATSYHLRQLERHGFVVEDAERGNGRDRWWRAAHNSTRTEYPDPGDLESREALDAFMQAVAVVHTEALQRAVEEAPLLPDDWHRASTVSDWSIRLTPRRAQALVEALDAALSGTEEDLEDPGAEDFTVILHAFPRPGRLPGREPAPEGG